MRILVISNLYPPDILGGYELGCRQAVDALRSAGHDVYVLTSVPHAIPSAAEPHVGRRLRLSGVYDGFGMERTTPAVRAARRREAGGVQAFNVHVLGQVVDEFRPDVAYVWNVLGVGGIGLLAGLQMMGVSWVMHIMDHVPTALCDLATALSGNTKPLTDAFNTLCRGHFISCSTTALDEIEASGVRIADRTVVIPNWVTTPGTPGRTDYRPDGRLRVMTAGSISWHKGTDVLIRAAKLLRDRGHTNFEIDIYGMGSDPAFQTMIQSDRLDHLRILGSRTQPELDALYPTYDVFLFPTWAREPFGFAPLEAMAHGCVVIMSRLCGIAEWVIDGADCVKVDRTPEAFADGLEGVLNGQFDPAVIGPRAARTALTWFPISSIIPRIEAELSAAVERGGGDKRSSDETFRVALLAEKMVQAMADEQAA